MKKNNIKKAIFTIIALIGFVGLFCETSSTAMQIPFSALSLLLLGIGARGLDKVLE